MTYVVVFATHTHPITFPHLQVKVRMVSVAQSEKHPELKVGDELSFEASNLEFSSS